MPAHISFVKSCGRIYLMNGVYLVDGFNETDFIPRLSLVSSLRLQADFIWPSLFDSLHDAIVYGVSISKVLCSL